MAKVYSTESGKLCPGCEKPIAACVCDKNQTHAGSTDGIIRVSRETKGRKGAGVTLIDGLAMDDRQLKDMARQLKSLCGCGGSSKAGRIEIQGDHRQKIVDWLLKQGFKAKQAGG